MQRHEAIRLVLDTFDFNLEQGSQECLAMMALEDMYEELRPIQEGDFVRFIYDREKVVGKTTRGMPGKVERICEESAHVLFPNSVGSPPLSMACLLSDLERYEPTGQDYKNLYP